MHINVEVYTGALAQKLAHTCEVKVLIQAMGSFPDPILFSSHCHSNALLHLKWQKGQGQNKNGLLS